MATMEALARRNEELHRDLLEVVDRLAQRVGVTSTAEQLDGVKLNLRMPEESMVRQREVLIEILRAVDIGIARQMDDLQSRVAEQTTPDVATAPPRRVRREQSSQENENANSEGGTR